MTIGSIQTVVVCVPSDSPQLPCPSGQAMATVQSYVFDSTNAASIEAQNGDFDYAAAAGIWGMAFTFVVGLYLVSKAVGVVLNRIKS